MKKIVLIGGGGHCKSVIDVIEQEGKFKIIGIVDKPEFLGNKVLGYSIRGSDDNLKELAKKHKNALITIGQTKTASLRKKLFGLALNAGFDLPNIISPNAYVSKHSSIGVGVVIMHHAIVNANSSIGDNCIINSKALIEHDCLISNHCHISTSSVVNGGAIIKEQTFIGSNTITKEYITIGEHSVIGGGLRIVRDLPEKTWFKNNENFAKINE